MMTTKMLIEMKKMHRKTCCSMMMKDDEDEIIGQATPRLFNDFEGLELFRREFSKKFDSII